MTWVCLTSYSGPVRLLRHHGDSTLAVTVPVVSALSVVVTAATAPTVVIVQTEVFALLAVVAPLLVASVELLPERMTVASATMTAVTVIGQGALLTATAR
jgi:hypothetical protein